MRVRQIPLRRVRDVPILMSTGHRKSLLIRSDGSITLIRKFHHECTVAEPDIDVPFALMVANPVGLCIKTPECIIKSTALCKRNCQLARSVEHHPRFGTGVTEFKHLSCRLLCQRVIGAAKVQRVD